MIKISSVSCVCITYFVDFRVYHAFVSLCVLVFECIMLFHHFSTFNFQLSTFQLFNFPLTFRNPSCQLSTFDVRLSTFNCQLSNFSTFPLLCESQVSSFNFQLSTFNFQLSTFQLFNFPLTLQPPNFHLSTFQLPTFNFHFQLSTLNIYLCFSVFEVSYVPKLSLDP